MHELYPHTYAKPSPYTAHVCAVLGLVLLGMALFAFAHNAPSTCIMWLFYAAISFSMASLQYVANMLDASDPMNLDNY